MRKFKILIFFLLCQMMFGQTAGEKILHCKISVSSGNVDGVTIVNLVNEKSAVSDHNGEFFILAKVDDLLVFSSVNLEYHRRIIEEEDLKVEIIIIKMVSKRDYFLVFDGFRSSSSNFWVSLFIIKRIF